MKFTDERRLGPAARALRRRILDVLPAGGYQLDRLFQLFDIEVTDAVPTAAVTAGDTATMRINPAFVARWCRTDEALFVLVLHELLHVVLGHTRLFRRATWVHNVAFDAVINAMIARTHPRPEFLALLTATNGWDTFPGRLLRPAPGWPHAPQPLPAGASAAERDLHARLYGSDAGDVTYHEIFELLQAFLQQELQAGRLPMPRPLLLGGHGLGDPAVGTDGEERIDPTLQAVLERMVAQWPAPFRAVLRDRGLRTHELALAGDRAPDRALQRALAEVFAAAGCGRPGPAGRRPAPLAVPATALTVLPALGDRRAVARAHLGLRPLFWDAPASRTVRRRPPAPRAFVYLDVSGSMDAFLPALRAALTRPVRDGAARLFAFSTEIHEVDVRTFGRCATRSTGGTEIGAVLAHLLALPARERPRAVVLVTDGCVGTPPQDLAAALRALRLRVHVALTPNGSRRELTPIAAVFHDLPHPDHRASLPAARTSA